MAVAYIQIRKGQIVNQLKSLGIKSKYHNKLCEQIRESIIFHSTIITRNLGTAFILLKNDTYNLAQKLNPQKRLIWL